jgi:ABC-2 type transport system permease protein
MKTFWTATYTLCQRELVRFYRQPSRVVGALGTAFLFWLVLGSGVPQAGYRAYFFPGTLLMSVMFTCIFSNASVIEDRQAGFLQSVMTAPVSRGAIVMGKILGGSLLSTLQGLILLPIGLFVGISFSPLPLLGAVACLFWVSFVMNAAGFWLAWKIESIPGFHTLMNLVLLPLWMASGAVFPSSGSGFMKILMAVNPLTYGVAGIRQGLYPNTSNPDLPSMGLCLLVLALWGMVFYAISSRAVAKSDVKRRS